MDLPAWLSYLGSLPYHSDPQFNFQQSLELARRLGIKKFSGMTIAVTGTNGKGSIVHALERFCCLHNVSCGLLTSPHLKRFNERIRINGVEVSDERLIAAFEGIKQQAEGLSLHYFHYAYFAGLLTFMHTQPQVVILEVGVGGRLDPINVIENDMTIISNIDYDHCDLLGDSLEKIAFEKAQLIRANTPVIFGGEQCPEAIQQVAQEKHAILYLLGHEFFYIKRSEDWSLIIHDLQQNKVNYNHLPIPNIILSNAASAMLACHFLQAKLDLKTEVDFKTLWQGFSIPGRMQYIQYKNRDCLLDVAHNPQAAQHLASELMKIKSKYRKVISLFAVGKKKNAVEMLQPMVPIINEWFVTTLSDRRISNIKELQQTFRQFPASCYYYADAKQALQAVLDHSNENDLIVVWGSFLMVNVLLDEIGD